MADLSDVETALTGCVTTGLYPEGLEAPAVIGAVTRIYRGWPIPSSLNADLAAGVVNVTISPETAMGHTTTRFAPIWSESVPVATISADVQGCSVTFQGIVQSGTAIGLCIDHRRSYVYRPQAHDTLGLIAANLAAQIRSDTIALVSGASLTVPGAASLVARIVPDGVSVQEIRRQTREIRVVVWCPTPALRDTASSIIDAALAAQPFIKLSDGTCARLIYSGTQVFDQSQNALLYRRDIIYTAEYATMISVPSPGMAFGNLLLNANQILV